MSVETTVPKKKSKAAKRVGPKCSPLTAPNGCGRPLPVSGVAKDFDASKAKARLEALAMRIRVAEGISTK